ncbi:hypothetical protein [Erythrobacter sp. JK5]|nr:hypothetical protein [Erythrobacter sp. JK5]QUL39525.1 hypothetical protein KDC96_02130 [Erythrobacter sp. JK5]
MANAAQEFENALKVTVINPDFIQTGSPSTPLARRIAVVAGRLPKPG